MYGNDGLACLVGVLTIRSCGKHYRSRIHLSTVSIVLESDGIGMAAKAICRFVLSEVNKQLLPVRYLIDLEISTCSFQVGFLGDKQVGANR